MGKDPPGEAKNKKQYWVALNSEIDKGLRWRS